MVVGCAVISIYASTQDAIQQLVLRRKINELIKGKAKFGKQVFLFLRAVLTWLKL